jgi:hypothetical protein
MQGIYKIENLINGKCYVGQSVDIEKRFAQHKRDSKYVNLHKYNYPLYNAIRKYGQEKFTFDVLELVDDNNLLTERELYWYNKLKPKYNILLPDRTKSKNQIKVTAIDCQTHKPIKEYESISQAARELGIDSSSITKACKGKLFEIGGFLWVYSDQLDSWQKPNYKKMNKPVQQIEPKTKQVIKVYDNSRRATEETGIEYQNINKVCLGLRNTAGGYAWEYVV